jgi:hypothetical protein
MAYTISLSFQGSGTYSIAEFTRDAADGWAHSRDIVRDAPTAVEPIVHHLTPVVAGATVLVRLVASLVGSAAGTDVTVTETIGQSNATEATFKANSKFSSTPIELTINAVVKGVHPDAPPPPKT